MDELDTLPAGRLCLEYANTADWHASANPDETLHSYHDLVNWAVSCGLLSVKAGTRLQEQAVAQPRIAIQVYSWAIELREAIYRIFAALAHGESPAARDIIALNEALPHAYALPELTTHDHAFDLRWRGDERGLDSLLWPIIRSAARLLTTGELDRIGQCADDRGCGYLFYDTSRNRSRRWCDMGSCGNRAKSQRHYARNRTPKAATAAPDDTTSGDNATSEYDTRHQSLTDQSSSYSIADDPI